MKKSLILMCFLMCVSILLISTTSEIYGKNGDDTIKIWSSPDLEELTNNLVQAYHKKFPEAKITGVSSENLKGSPLKGDNMGLITKSHFDDYDCQMSWRLAIGRDILIPVMNPENPFREEIESKGISPDEFRSLFTNKDSKTWGLLLDNNESAGINCWCLPETSTRNYLANFFNTDPANLESKLVKNLDEMLNHIGKDTYALGFCRLANVLDPETKKLDPRIVPVPIDINANNEIDYFEDIYSSVNELERGAWIGKYPKELYTCIYAINPTPPADGDRMEFMKWLLTDGQDYLFINGYSELVFSERNSKIQSLLAPVVPVSAGTKKPLKAINILLFILISLGVLTAIVFILMKRRSAPLVQEGLLQKANTPLFGENSVKIQGGLFYDKSHTWAFMEKNGIVKTGIDDFLQHVTGKITKVKMKKAGEKVVKGETYITLVQEGKHLEIKSPVSGIIINANEKLHRHPSLLNSEPLTDGWIYSVETANWAKDLRAFLLGEEYINWLKNEFSRLKDFFSFKLKLGTTEKYEVILQEGGELKEGLLEHFGPEIWEEFQSGFINNSR